MNRYESSNFRPVFAIGAVAMTVITIGLMVILPAEMSDVGPEVSTLASTTAITPVSAEIAASACEQKTAFVSAPHVAPEGSQLG
jgi:hypothetical protein